MCAALRSLDAVVGEDAEGRVQFRRAALHGLCGRTDGKDALAKLRHGCVGGGGGLRHLVDHRPRLIHAHAQGGHSVRHHILTSNLP